MNPEFWKGKRVLLTGHTGFKGSWMSLWLQSMGASVTGISLAPPSQPNLFEVADVASGMQSIIGDVRDLQQLSEVVNQSEAEVVIHMAAQALVRHSYSNPVETYATNVMGTVNLLEAVRHSGSVRAVVVVTSDKCYDNREWIWGYREDEPMGGYDPYSNSKGCAELVTAAYRQSFYNQNGNDIAVATVRAGNVIGGGDWAEDRLLPDMVRAIADKKSVLIRNPHAIRPWQHVLEPLSGYLMLAERLYEDGKVFAEGWNFGPEDRDARPVGWIVDTFTSIWGEGAVWELDGAEHPHEAHYFKLDCSKARMRVGWQPCMSLSDALGSIAEWYKAYFGKQDMHNFTLRQIVAYQELKNQ